MFDANQFDEDQLFKNMALWVEGLASSGDFTDDPQGLTQAAWDNMMEEYRSQFPEQVESLEFHDITIKEMIYADAREALNR